MAIHLELENLYFKEKEETENNTITIEKQRARLKRLKELMPSIDYTEIWNCHYTAHLLQHGETTEDYILAHAFAKKAVDLGSNVTKWLYAATLDRSLVSQGKKQKFGTQFVEKDGKWELLPVDGTISDEKRKEYGVPTLKEALEHFNKKYSK